MTPGAGTYDPTLTETGREANMNVMSDGEKMKSSSFASNSAQRGKFALPQAGNPGAGTYSPEFTAVEVRAHPGSISKTGRDHVRRWHSNPRLSLLMSCCAAVLLC